LTGQCCEGTPCLRPPLPLLCTPSSALPSSSRPAPRYNDSEDWGGASQREQEEAFALLPRQSSGQYASVESAAVPNGDAARAMNAPGGYMGVAKLLVGVYAILMGAMIYTNGGVRAPSLPPSLPPPFPSLYARTCARAGAGRFRRSLIRLW